MNHITVEEYINTHGKEQLLVEPAGDIFICRACLHNKSKVFTFRNQKLIIITHINAVKHVRAHYKYIESLIHSNNNKCKIAEIFKFTN